jgi:hypothetical protein
MGRGRPKKIQEEPEVLEVNHFQTVIYDDEVITFYYNDDILVESVIETIEEYKKRIEKTTTSKP